MAIKPNFKITETQKKFAAAVVVALLGAYLYISTRPEADGVMMFQMTMFSEKRTLADFAQAAFSAAKWNNDDTRECEGNDAPVPGYVGGNLGDEGGWWRPFMKPAKGFPKPCRLHRWEGNEITIGVDWPPQPRTRQYPGERPPVSAFSQGLFASWLQIEQQVRPLIPVLQKMTGKKVTFVPPGDPREYTADFARIRIIPVRTVGFKMTRRDAHAPPPGDWDILENEYQFWGGVPFSEDMDYQPDGYLLPHYDGSLGMAVCKIYPGYTEPVEKAMVSECLMRALGFPGVSTITETTSVLTPWNANFRANLDPDLSAYYKFLKYDRLLIKLLYCPAVKSGMTVKEATEALSKNKFDCVQTATAAAAE
jgi:hypothetical protein